METKRSMMVLPVVTVVCSMAMVSMAADSPQAKPAAQDNATELAKKMQNPVADLINQPSFADGQNRNHGLGNIQFQGFFSPKEKVNDWIIGFGPYLEFPTNSGPDGRFGMDNWSAGPALVALQMKGPWVYGGLVTHLWSYYGNDPQTNLTSVQPFLNYNMDDGWYLSSAPTLIADWSADSSNQWTIPVGGGIGKVFKIGKQPVNASLRPYYNVQAPETGADWQLQLQVQFLFPK